MFTLRILKHLKKIPALKCELLKCIGVSKRKLCDKILTFCPYPGYGFKKKDAALLYILKDIAIQLSPSGTSSNCDSFRFFCLVVASVLKVLY